MIFCCVIKSNWFDYLCSCWAENSKVPQLGYFRIFERLKNMSKLTIAIGSQNIRIDETEYGEYLAVTDLAKLVNDNTGKVINSWIKSVRALEFMRAWEIENNPDFNDEAYKEIRMQAGSAAFFLSAKEWIRLTNAIGLKSTRGRHGGTFAHHLIALEFCATLSAEFRLSVFKEYIELKSSQSVKWLKTNELYLRKMEERALEIRQFAREIQGEYEEE